MVELLVEWLLQDGSVHPDRHKPIMTERGINSRRVYVCDSDDQAQVKRYRGLHLSVPENDFLCPYVMFDSVSACMARAPELVARYEMLGIINGAEIPPAYGIRWRCVSGATS